MGLFDEVFAELLPEGDRLPESAPINLDEITARREAEERFLRSPRGRFTTQAQELIKESLSTLAASQKLYAKLGASLDKTVPPLSKDVRATMVEARRLLEEYWGVNSVRTFAGGGRSKAQLVLPPVQLKNVNLHPDVDFPTKEPDTRLAAVTFDVRSEAGGRGRNIRMFPVRTSYGVSGLQKTILGELKRRSALARETAAALNKLSLRPNATDKFDKLATKALNQRESDALFMDQAKQMCRGTAAEIRDLEAANAELSRAGERGRRVAERVREQSD